MSSASLSTAGVLLIAVVAIEYGGISLLRSSPGGSLATSTIPCARTCSGRGTPMPACW